MAAMLAKGWRRETSRLGGTGTMAGVAVCIALVVGLRETMVEASVRPPVSVAGLAPVVFDPPPARVVPAGSKAPDRGQRDDARVMGVLNQLSQEMARAVSKDGTDISIDSVIRITHLMNTILERVDLGLATWTNNRNLKMLEAAAARDRLKSVAEILSVEQRRNMHKPGGRIADNSGACGLLWLRRSLQFFVELVSETIADAQGPPASLARPAASAYQRTLGVYHNFMTRGFFQTLLSTLPSSEKIIPAVMTPIAGFETEGRVSHWRRRKRRSDDSEKNVPNWDATVAASQTFVARARKTLSVWEELHVSYDMEDSRRY